MTDEEFSKLLKPLDAVISDLDGTLADCEHRRHFVTGDKKDFDAFYNAMASDTLKKDIRNLLDMYSMNGFHIIICTGRPESYRKITEAWLSKHGVTYYELRMRPDDKRHHPDFEIKEEMLKDIQKKRKVIIAIDDRNQVVDMWRRNGITCLQVADGDF